VKESGSKPASPNTVPSKFSIPTRSAPSARTRRAGELGNQGTGEPENRGTREPENQRTGELGNQGTGEPGNWGTREPGNRGTREPGNQGIGELGKEGGSPIPLFLGSSGPRIRYTHHNDAGIDRLLKSDRHFRHDKVASCPPCRRQSTDDPRREEVLDAGTVR